MNNSLRLTFLALVALAGLATIVSAEQNLPEGSSCREQTHFSMEENPEHVVTLPEAVLDLLTNDETVVQEKSCVKKMASLGEARSSLFVASEVHLDGTEQSDFLARACLMGANISPFWIVRKDPRGFRLILSWSAHDLDVLPTKTRDYHDLRLTSATANTISTTICKFDGKKYVSTKRDLEPWP